MSAVTGAGSPRIYLLPAAMALSPTQASSWLAHIRKLGFSHVLVTADTPHLSLLPGLAADHVAALVAACGKARLKLLLDVDVSAAPADSPLPQQHPDWFFRLVEPDALPDPRYTPEAGQVQWRLGEPDAAAAAGQWWQWTLAKAFKSGVAGVRLLFPDLAEAPWWRDLFAQLRQQAPESLFIAATADAPEGAQELLRDAGFDYALYDIAGWDFHSPTLGRELEQLERVAPVLVIAGVPPRGRLGERPQRHEDWGQREPMRRARGRAAWLAAASARGWLMPAGFEFAAALFTDRDLPVQPPAQLAGQGAVDLCEEVSAVNQWLAEQASEATRPIIYADGAGVALWRVCGAGAQAQGELLLLNSWLTRAATLDLAEIAAGAPAAFGPWQREGKQPGPITLEAGEVLRLQAGPAKAIATRHAAAARRQRLDEATSAPRIAIEAVTPAVDGGRFAVKRVVGDVVTVQADIFIDGHERLAARLCWRAADDRSWHEQEMLPLVNDRYAASFTPQRMGRYEYRIIAWRNAWESYEHELIVKREAGQDVALELEEGRRLVNTFATKGPAAARRALKPLATRIRQTSDGDACYQLLVDPALRQAMEAADPRDFLVEGAVLNLEVDRRAAQFASWYELFPRSEGAEAGRHGTLRDVIRRLPAIRDMGFDVLYFPPIHPIGTAFRKGPNNTLDPGPDDPGSPYAIGSPEGGHTDIHPQLGSIEDFRALRDAAHEHGLELALDFAIQCSPDHPWLKEHPGWFDWRPDGTIRYAENPPKKYQDIVNVDFYAEMAVPALWEALRDVVLYWAGEGVRIFRVDNPHTKPLPFWEWMIARVREQYPDALFLAEAFTRPKPMYRLAKAGFSQSYTYFTWRHSKVEFIDYLTELTEGPAKDFFRPHFFVNTPDINPLFLQSAGRSGFLIRAALAATLSGLWGMYSGFELCEAAPISGREDYLDSEKYQLRQRDYSTPGNIIAEITRLNAIRREHPALQSHLGVRFLSADNPAVLFFEKVSPSGHDRVLVAINLNPHADELSALHLPLGHWRIAEDAALPVRDLLHEVSHTWRGGRQEVWLGAGMPYAIWHIDTGATHG